MQQGRGAGAGATTEATPRRCSVRRLGAAAALLLFLVLSVGAVHAPDVGAQAGPPPDPNPKFFVNSPGVFEQGGTVQVRVSRTGANDTTSSVTVTINPGTATAGADYTPVGPVTVTLVSGQFEQLIDIPIIDDDLDETDEQFTVNLSNPVGAGILVGAGTVTILDNDQSPTVSIGDAGPVAEGAGTAAVPVSLSEVSGRAVTVVVDTTAGSATAGDDFTPLSGVVFTVPAGQLSAGVAVPVIDDRRIEGNEQFTVGISAPTGATLADATGTVTVRDDDSFIRPGSGNGGPRTTTTRPSTTPTTGGPTGDRRVAPAEPTSRDRLTVDSDTPAPGRRPGDRSDGDRAPADGDGDGVDRGDVGGPGSGRPGADGGPADGGPTDGGPTDGGPTDGPAAGDDDESAAGSIDRSSSSRGGDGGGAHRSDLVASVVRPGDVEITLPRIAGSLAIAGALLGLIAYSSELFDSTFESNEERIRRAFRWIPRLAGDSTRRRRGLAVTACVLLGGGVFTALSDEVGVNSTTAMLYLGMTTAVALTSFGLVLADVFFVRRRQPTDGKMQALPLGLAIGVAGVLLSKAVGFQPGYAYGVVAGWAFATPLSRRDQGHVAALTSLNLLGVALVAWLVREPVTERVLQGDPAPGWMALEAALTGIFLLCLDSGIVGMIPIRFLRGRAILRWSKPAWVALTLFGLTLFVLLLLQPGGGQIVEHDTLATNVIVLCLLFTGGSFAFWAWFRFRPDPHAPPESQADSVEALS